MKQNRKGMRMLLIRREGKVGIFFENLQKNWTAAMFFVAAHHRIRKNW